LPVKEATTTFSMVASHTPSNSESITPISTPSPGPVNNVCSGAVFDSEKYHCIDGMLCMKSELPCGKPHQYACFKPNMYRCVDGHLLSIS
jgi:hypothetical protein